MQLDVYSAGKNLGRHFSVKKNWKQIYSDAHGGIYIVVIDQYDGSVISKQGFNTYYAYLSDNPDNLKLMKYIRDIPFGAIVCVAISYDGVSQLSDAAKVELMLLGSSLISGDVKPYGSWALIGAKGVRPGEAIEVESSNHSTHVWGRIHLKQNRPPIFNITAESAGTDSGKFARITVNGTVVNVSYTTIDDSGLHVVVIEPETGLIWFSNVFDPWQMSDKNFPTTQ